MTTILLSYRFFSRFLPTVRLSRRVPSFVMCALFAAAVPAAAQLHGAETIPLTAGDGTPFEVTRAFIRVPEMRSTPAPASTIDLAVVRVRRAGTAPTRTVHVILAGGPGDSGVEQALGLARQGGSQLANLMDGDVVGIDQRGTGRSVPNLSTNAMYPLPLDQPGSPEAWLPIIRRVAAAEAARFRGEGIRLEAYNTRESADDVVDVVRALGYERAILWGRSYGTHLALAVTARHEDLVARLILVSPEGLDHTWKLPAQVDTVLARLEERGASGLVGSLRTVITRLRREPVAVTLPHPQGGKPTTVVLGAFDVQWIVAQALGDPRLLATLPSAIRAMEAGNFSGIAPVVLLRRERTGVQSAMKMMMDLSSGASSTRLTRIAGEETTALLGNAINVPTMHLSDAWGAVDLGDAFRKPVVSSVPALLLVGDLDPRTPVENAKEVAATLPRSKVVVIENATHQFDLFGNPTLRGLLDRFLRDQPVEVDTVSLPPLSFR
jgi:pimeloyl-ACP methyl ester carboxylesterase